jgi:MacB-like periplasmic core domain/FtsX-like permease family
MRWKTYLDGLLGDLRYAVRSLRKDRKFPFVAIFALALGIGASTVVFSVFYNLLFNAFAAKDANRLVVPVLEDAEKPGYPGYDYQLWIKCADVKYLREHNQVFENVVGSHSGIAAVQYGARAYQFENGHVWPDAFEFYGVAPILGRRIVAEDGKPGAPPVFVMSYRTWKGEFGAETGILGKTFVIEGEPTTLIGVMPERFHVFGTTQEIWTPVSEAAEAEKRADFNVLARVKRGLEMRLIAGRWLTRTEVQTRQFSAVINEGLARTLFGESNPVGKRLEVRGLKSKFNHSRANLPENPVFEIVGVAGDTKNAGPQAPVVPMAFIPPMITGDFLVQIRTKVEPGSMMHAVQRAVWSADRGEVFWVFDPLAEFLEEHTYALPEFGVSLSGPLAGIALLLVVIGVFSVMAYSVSLRTQEIGIRMALGAQQNDILGMVLRNGSALIAAGICIGLFASYGLTRFLASQIWGVSVTDPWTFGGVAAMVVAVGLAACFLPARRATRVDPLVALRYE